MLSKIALGTPMKSGISKRGFKGLFVVVIVRDLNEEIKLLKRKSHFKKDFNH